MFTSKQDLKTVPFQVLYEKAVLAGRTAVDNLSKLEESAYERMIARKELEWLDTHEAPDEGSLREQYPYNGPTAADKASERAAAQAECIKDQIDQMGLKTKASWLLPQIAAYIAKMKLPRNENGKIIPFAFLEENFPDSWHRGLYMYCMTAQRGNIVGSQYTVPFRNYSALVPLLMMPAKKFNGIPYSDWDRESIKSVVDPQLFKAMTCPMPISAFSFDDIVANREHGLRIKSGKDEGQLRNPATTFKLYGSASEDFASLPWLAQVMLTQIWLAHPTNRTDVMILDWENWDNMPGKLIQTELIPDKDEKKKTTKIDAEVPWE